ncbi:MAG: thioredoxin family protein [Oscillatoriophycideae cyanobacterium NC_groundwater_1537_Pr4_S-0.65um_50_18]|nr:thioredoxin family protein [Oscillatoriophycideae cyanobacterium NC_groundwater_1537_Pr4_S-0.65um_50_18]
METMSTSIGSYAPDFELPGTDHTVHHLTRYLEKFRAVGVVIICNHCPYVRLYVDRLQQIQADFQDQGFTLVAINGNDEQRYPEDGFEPMKAFAAEQQLNFPYLRDITQDVVRSFGAKHTPEVYLLDRLGIIRYQGAIDDNPQNPQAVERDYFRWAIEQLLEDKEISVNSTESVGCSVKWRR